MDGVVTGTVIGADRTIAELNQKAISKLYDLIDSLNEKSDPELILACTKGLSQLNASLKGNDILPRQETPEERAIRERQEALKGIISGEN